MGSTKYHFYSLFLVFLSLTAVQAQQNDPYLSSYANAKSLLDRKEYQLAYQELKPLLSNQYESRAQAPMVHYLYALAASQSDHGQDALSALSSLRTKFPDWKQGEVQYLLADVHFRSGNLEKGISATKAIESENLVKEAKEMKMNYLAPASMESLSSLLVKYPEDREVALVYGKKLATLPSKTNHMKLAELRKRFNFKEKEIAAQELLESKKKSTYNVAVLFPFMYRKRQEDPNYRGNQFALDMYNGVKLAVTKLREEGINIRLTVYDTEQDSLKVQQILAGLNPDSVDLMLGPIYPEASSLAAAYAKVNQVMMVNPLTDRKSITTDNAYAFSITPSVETRAAVVTRYINEYMSEKDAVILFTDLPKEVNDAEIYSKSAKGVGIKTAAMIELRKENLHSLTDRLKPYRTEKTGHIYVKSDKSYVGAALINSLTVLGTQVPVFVSEEWITFNSVTFEQMENRNFHIITTDLIAYSDPQVREFQKRYVQMGNVFPSMYAFKGFDMMMLFGEYMGKYGNRCMAELHKPQYIPGHVTPGFSFVFGNDNALVRIYKFEEGYFTLVNPINEEDGKQAESVKMQDEETEK